MAKLISSDWWKSSKSAAYEWGVGAVWALSPFVFGALVFVMLQEMRGSDWRLSSAFLSTFGRGELLIFIVTFIAPTFWTVSLDPEGSRQFPARPLWVCGISFLLAGTSVAFGAWRAFGYNPSTYTNIVQVSVWLAVFAVLLRFAVLLFHQRRLPSVEDEFNKETNEFAEDYAQKKQRDANGQ